MVIHFWEEKRLILSELKTWSAVRKTFLAPTKFIALSLKILSDVPLLALILLSAFRKESASRMRYLDVNGMHC